MHVHLLYHGLSEGQGLASVWLRTNWNELRWPYLPCTVSHEYGHERGDNDVCIQIGETQDSELEIGEMRVIRCRFTGYVLR